MADQPIDTGQRSIEPDQTGSGGGRSGGGPGGGGHGQQPVDGAEPVKGSLSGGWQSLAQVQAQDAMVGWYKTKYGWRFVPEKKG